MSTERKVSPKLIRNEHGTILCSCGCGSVPRPPRRTWFSEACVQRWRERNDLTWIRRQVEDRDRGICATCGLATVRLRSRLPEPYRNYEPTRYDRRFHTSGSWTTGGFLEARYKRACEVARKWTRKWRQAADRRREALQAAGWPLHRQTWWDADHIIPVCEGGGQCGIENYRTLCIPCHKKETKELAARRAQARKILKTRKTPV